MSQPEHPAPGAADQPASWPAWKIRIWSGVFALVCIIVSTVALHSFGNDSVQDDSRAFKATGVVGQTVDVNSGEVTVLDVKVGQTLAGTDGRPEVHSPGVFVGVDVQVACPKEEENPGQTVKLHGGSRTYTEWAAAGVVGPPAGYQTTARMIFEVDPADLNRLVFEAYRGEIIAGYERHAWIDLGLAGRADQLRAAAAGTTVKKLTQSTDVIA
ncbi:MAG: hypothetical protein ACR2I1_06675 [Propionibacteriaceae bacterium]